MEKNILFVAPYVNLVDLSNSIIKEYSYPVQVVQGSSKNAGQIIKQWQNNDIEVIISRGGTYNFIKQISNLPVVEIKVDLFDIIRAIKNIKHGGGDIGFIGYNNVVFGEAGFRELFGVNLYKIILQESKDNFNESISEAVDNGVVEFIGDNIGINLIKERGLTGYKIESGREAIITAIEEALRVREVRRKERALAEQSKIIMDYINDGIVAIDEYGKIDIFNKAAEKICSNNSLSKAELINFLGINPETGPVNKSIGEIEEIGKDCIIAVNKSPININNINYGAVATIQNATHIQKMEQEIRKKLSSKGLTAKYHFDDIIYNSDIMKETIDKAKKYAVSDSTVLIQGETGNGKELFAHSIHNSSTRCKNPFVAVNCAALPENLLESELFGYSEGAFTGAKKGGKIGLFELAHRGTIFLDEIGDMPYNLQTRLLRVLQEKEIMRIGDDRIIPIDVRVIASTNKDLYESVKLKKFREDLYYRLNILSLNIPPLRQRKEDIYPLAKSFLEEFSKKNNKVIKGIEKDVMTGLLNHSYEGNVRELRGIIERAVVVSENNYITLQDVGIITRKNYNTDTGTLKEIELRIIKETLEKTGNNYNKASKLLGIDRTTIYRKLNS